MRRIGCILLLTMLVALMGAGSASALVIDKPDFSYDSNAQGYSGLNFDASTGLLTINAALLAIFHPDGTTTVLNPMGTVDMSARLQSVEVKNGLLVIATFGADAVTPNASFKDGQGNTLLSGNAWVYLTMKGVIDDRTGSGEGILTQITVYPSDWALYQGQPADAGIVNFSYNLSVPFSATMFQSNFSGEAKGDAGPVPEPCTMLLLGGGLLGLGGLRRKFRK